MSLPTVITALSRYLSLSFFFLLDFSLSIEAERSSIDFIVITVIIVSVSHTGVHDGVHLKFYRSWGICFHIFLKVNEGKKGETHIGLDVMHFLI